jgi:pre-mRNA-processing factor 39
MKRSQPGEPNSLLKKPKSLSKDDPDYSSDDSDLVDEKPAQSIDFSRIWLTVKQKPHDFTSWCTLLQLSEQENKLGLIRKAFNEFFKHYPYTYAYWKKFADLERRHGHNYHAKRVIKRGLEANPMSIDLWIYCIELYTSRYTAEHSHMQSKKRREDAKKKRENGSDAEDDGEEKPEKEENDEDEPNIADFYNKKGKKAKESDETKPGVGKEEKVFDDGHAIGSLSPDRIVKLRNLYWKAVNTAGQQFKAGRLWSKFIYFERQNGHPSFVLPIYAEILRIPMENYNEHFTEMKEFINDCVEPVDLIEEEELKEICEQYLEDANANMGIGDKGDQAFRLAQSGELSEDALQQIRDAVVDRRRDQFKDLERMVARVWNFEDNIKRPYFHVKPIDKAQLKNWVEYCDFEIDAGTSHNIVKNLFERCMVSCALYEDMWLKFANWAEYESKDIPLARSCYLRCCKIHLPKRANCRIEWATFEERHGKLDEARMILEDLNDRVPGLMAVAARLFHLKRRSGKMTIEQLISSLKTEWANAQEFRDRDGPEKEHFWACELAWFLCKENRIGESRMVLDSAIERAPSAARLYRVRAEIESFNKTLFGWLDRLCDVYEKAAGCTEMEMGARVAFSGHLYGILERESTDMKKISMAYDLHRALRKDLQRDHVRSQKQAELHAYENGEQAAASATARGHSAAPDGSVFMKPHIDHAPQMKSDLTSTRVADYSSVGGNYQTHQSGGAYGNSYTWTYNNK